MLNNDIKISIIVPVYNVEKYLQKCIDTLINQTYKNIEIILYDDGSTDDSYKICTRASTKDKRIILLKGNNAGPAIARNNSLKYATGQYVTFVDSDDYVESQYVENMVKELYREDVDIVIAGFEKVSKSFSKKYFLQESSGNREKFIKTLPKLMEKCLVQGPCWKLFKLEIIRKNGVYFNNSWKLGEDAFFVYSYIKYVKSYSTVPCTCYKYIVRNSNSLSQIYTLEKITNNIYLSNMLNEITNGIYQDMIARALCGNYVSFCTELFLAEESYKNKVKTLEWAMNQMNQCTIFGQYNENHFVRKLFKKLTILKKKRLLINVINFRIFLKKYRKTNEEGNRL